MGCLYPSPCYKILILSLYRLGGGYQPAFQPVWQCVHQEQQTQADPSEISAKQPATTNNNWLVRWVAIFLLIDRGCWRYQNKSCQRMVQAVTMATLNSRKSDKDLHKKKLFYCDPLSMMILSHIAMNLQC